MFYSVKLSVKSNLKKKKLMMKCIGISFPLFQLLMPCFKLEYDQVIQCTSDQKMSRNYVVNNGKRKHRGKMYWGRIYSHITWNH